MNAPDCICSPGRLPLGAFCAGRDDLEREALHDDRISIRAPRAGCDHYTLHVHLGFGIFQSTRPVWGATDPYRVRFGQYQISIHAPRVGRDRLMPDLVIAHVHFNPRAPCGARQVEASTTGVNLKFQSTRPVWGATSRGSKYWSSVIFQSTRPVWGATDDTIEETKPKSISIHAPRVGRDQI